MNSKTAQLTENGTEIVRLFARFALGASFLSAAADRFGLWGPYGAKNVSWRNFAHFVEYTGASTGIRSTSITCRSRPAKPLGSRVAGRSMKRPPRSMLGPNDDPSILTAV